MLGSHGAMCKPTSVWLPETYKRIKSLGVINISEIVRGAFQSGYLGYYAMAGWAGRGYMTDALRQAIDYAFHEMQLQRLEANIQPGNVQSIALVKKLAFMQEGVSPKYLKINGVWCDHERWALLNHSA